MTIARLGLKIKDMSRLSIGTPSVNFWEDRYFSRRLLYTVPNHRAVCPCALES